MRCPAISPAVSSSGWPLPGRWRRTQACLLLDEPTSALDPELVNEVLEVIRRLAIDDGLTMIISTHQIRFADEVADRVAFLSGGAILEEGPAHEVLTHPKNPLTARFLSVMEADKAPEMAR